MSETLAEYLTEQGADASTLQHAVRYLAGSLSDDLPVAAQRQELADAAQDEAAVAEAIDVLEHDSAVLLDADLAVLAALWSDPERRNEVRDAVAAAKAKLPVVETVVISTAAMYALYLVITGGKTRSFRKVTRRPDGSYEETEETEFHDPSGPLKALGSILGKFLP
jgi:hypothetical protein